MIHDIGSFRRRYANGETPHAVLTEVIAAVDALDDPAVWITRVAREVILARADALGRLSTAEREACPLFGIPYAVKDNIDVAGLPTTAGCPSFAYVPERSATVVQLLEEAGAVLIGKTNLDQFATGLVGTRSPYGVPRNPHHAAYIPGGSSSGSAVATARGLVAFALGTDTAGSGRVPAAFTATYGLKPTKGLVSTTGVVPACRSLDCVSIFATSLDDAALVLDTIGRFDPTDPFARIAPPPFHAREAIRFGSPRTQDQLFFGDAAAEASFAHTLDVCRHAGLALSDVDLSGCFQAGQLLYDGPFVAERTAALGSFIDAHPDEVLEVTRTIIASGQRFRAIDAFHAQYAVAQHARDLRALFERIDVLLVPTTPTIYRIAEVEAEPYALNARLGTYTNFVNLLDLCAVALPSGWYANGLPIGVTVIAPAFADRLALAAARQVGSAVGFQPRTPMA